MCNKPMLEMSAGLLTYWSSIENLSLETSSHTYQQGNRFQHNSRVFPITLPQLLPLSVLTFFAFCFCGAEFPQLFHCDCESNVSYCFGCTETDELFLCCESIQDFSAEKYSRVVT